MTTSPPSPTPAGRVRAVALESGPAAIPDRRGAKFTKLTIRRTPLAVFEVGLVGRSERYHAAVEEALKSTPKSQRLRVRVPAQAGPSGGRLPHRIWP